MFTLVVHSKPLVFTVRGLPTSSASPSCAASGPGRELWLIAAGDCDFDCDFVDGHNLPCHIAEVLVRYQPEKFLPVLHALLTREMQCEGGLAYCCVQGLDNVRT